MGLLGVIVDYLVVVGESDTEEDIIDHDTKCIALLNEFLKEGSQICWPHANI